MLRSPQLISWRRHCVQLKSEYHLLQYILGCLMDLRAKTINPQWVLGVHFSPQGRLQVYYHVIFKIAVIF